MGGRRGHDIVRAALSGVVLAAAPAPARPGEVEIVAFGEFGARRDTPGTPAGTDGGTEPGTGRDGAGTERDKAGTERDGAGTDFEAEARALIRRTACIEARLGLRFGIAARRRSPGGGLPVRVEIRHPPFRGPDGRTQRVESWAATLTRAGLYSGWSFEAPYELAPGPWRFVILRRGRVAAERTFTVVAPGAACPGEP
ncbi:MAG TPA: DUF3859 domain-containing protein [Microvirga sp.]|nr:DUF3859 domain-containing protein [Microvirga sp.]